MSLPDKHEHKSTTTSTLRDFIRDQAKKFDKPTYLEIGYDKGYTMMVINHAFERCVGVDNNPDRLRDATEVKEACGAENVELVLGTIDNVPEDEYHIVFIDADHGYESIKSDFCNMVLRNQAHHYIVIFHDYGLVESGVKKFVQEFFKREEINFAGDRDDWNPLGGDTNDWEAVMVEIGKDG